MFLTFTFPFLVLLVIVLFVVKEQSLGYGKYLSASVTDWLVGIFNVFSLFLSSNVELGLTFSFYCHKDGLHFS